MNTTWKLRVSDGELAEWKQAAAADGKMLSEWIRELCNGEVEAHRVPDVPRTPKVRKGGGRESASRKSVETVPGSCECGHRRASHFNGGNCNECECKMYELVGA